jgi:hypothetical protein
MAARPWNRLSQRAAAPTPLEVLLGDTATARAAADAFAQVESPDAMWWPLVASVGVQTVALRLGGLSVPEPAEPWRAGHDPRIWTADRADLATSARSSPRRPLVIGRTGDSVVFVDTARAPGPIIVLGDQGSSAEVRDLLARQSPGEPGGDPEPGAPCWPVEVEGETIVLLGLAVARVFSTAHRELAARLAAAPDPMSAAPESSPVSAAVPAVDPAADPAPEALDAWVRQVRQAAAAALAPEPALGLATGPTPGLPPKLTPEPTPEPAPGPDPVRDLPDLAEFDDWASGFAASSADPAGRQRKES